MAIGIIILVAAILIVAIWVVFMIKGIKQKFFTFLLIALILFLLLSFTIVFRGEDLSINNISDLGRLGKVYFSWLVNIFDNVKTVTSNVIKMNWAGNSTT